MDIGTLCKREVVGIAAGASVQEAAALMCDEHVGALVVVTGEDNPKVVGILTDRDIALDVVGRARVADGLFAGDIAKSPPLSVLKTASIDEAVATMAKAGVRRLLVVDEDDSVVGLVSSDDLLACVAEQASGLARAMREGIDRESSQRGVAAIPARSRFVVQSFGRVAAQ